MVTLPGTIGADVLRTQVLNGIITSHSTYPSAKFTLKRGSYMLSHCVDHYKVASKEKALVNLKWPAIKVVL